MKAVVLELRDDDAAVLTMEGRQMKWIQRRQWLYKLAGALFFLSIGLFNPPVGRDVYAAKAQMEMKAGADQGFQSLSESDAAQTQPDAVQPDTPFDKAAPVVICTSDIQKKVKLKWKEVKGATKYEIYRANKSGGSYKKLGTVTGLSYQDKTAKKRKNYYYYVQAIRVVSQPDGTVVVNSGNHSKKLKVYVRPKTPKMVICGECYVEGIEIYAPKQTPSNMKLISKVGINSSRLLTLSCFGGRTAIQKIKGMHPDRVYFLVGANEFTNNNPGYTVGNFEKMRKILQKQNPNIEIVLIKISPQRPIAERAQYNKAYKNYAKKHSNVYFCNATDVMDNGHGMLKAGYDAGDGCHWTKRATQEMMIALKRWSRKNLGTW